VKDKTARSVEELFPIIGYARAGDLRSVKEWIDAGSPLNLPPGKKTRRQSPLQIAINNGFLTLTEMLLDGGADPKADEALRHAVNCGRPDIAKLLLDRGAAVDDVSFAEVCYSNNVEMVRLFLDRGADPITGHPFFHALNCSLQPLLGLFKELLAKDPRLQPQADATLGYYAEKKNPRCVGLLIWAGARPDAEITLEDAEDPQTALEVAVRSGDLATLKTMKPGRFPALLPKMVGAVGLGNAEEMTEFLFSIGAPVNDEADGSSSLLRSALWHIGWHSEPGMYGQASPAKVDEDIATVERLLRLGAKFPPTEPRSLRRNLQSLSPDQLIRLLGILSNASALPAESLMAVISTPKMKALLGARCAEAVRIVSGEPPESPKSAKQELQKEKPLRDLAELRERAEEGLVSFLRSHEHLHFTERKVCKHWTRGEFRRRIKMTPEDKRDEVAILNDAGKAISKRLKSAELVMETWAHYSFPVPTFRLHGNATWSQAIREVCEIGPDELLPLTYQAERLLKFVESGGSAWVNRDDLAKRIGGSNYTKFEVNLCREIESKRGIEIKVTERRVEGTSYDSELMLKITDRKSPVKDHELATITNLKWPHGLGDLKKSDIDRFRATVLDLIMSAARTDAEPFYLFKVHTADALTAVFPKLELSRYSSSGPVCALLRSLRLPEGVRIAYDLQDAVPEWWAALAPVPSWPVALQSVKDYLGRPTLEQRFGLSGDAARLVEWIETRNPKEMLGTWTPVVEPRISGEIGFQTEWPEENLPAFLQMLADEINGKTAYQLSLQPWKEEGKVRTRIKVEKKRTSTETLAQAIARLAQEKGMQLSPEQSAAIMSALATPSGVSK
jgi:hypothetical protein